MNRLLLAALILLELSGCSKITLLRTREIREVNSEVKALRKDVQALSKAVDDLSVSQGGASSKMKADLTSMFSDLQGQISRLNAELDETQHRLSKLYEKTSKIEQKKFVVNGAKLSPGIAQAESDSTEDKMGANLAPNGLRVVDGLDIESLYNQAREDYIAGRYDLAFQGFKTVLDKDEGGAFKDNALYWMAESSLKQNKEEQAIELYQRCIQEFPKGNKACSARFKLGLIYDKRQDRLKRNEEWNKLLKSCAGSNEAKRAEELMKE